MRNAVGIAVVIAMTSFVVGARAQTAVAPDPGRLALAHEILEAQGVSRQYDAHIKSALSVQMGLIRQIVPADQASRAEEMFSYMAEEELKAVPSMFEDAASVYAANLNETELRDMLYWSKSSSGKAFYAKVPAINRELMIRQIPLLKAILEGSMHKAVEKTCAEKPCTPEQRQMLTEVGDKLLKGVS